MVMLQFKGETTFIITDLKLNTPSRSSIIPTSYCTCLSGQLNKKVSDCLIVGSQREVTEKFWCREPYIKRSEGGGGGGLGLDMASKLEAKFAVRSSNKTKNLGSPDTRRGKAGAESHDFDVISELQKGKIYGQCHLYFWRQILGL